MIIDNRKADQPASQSAKKENNFQKQYITALPIGKDTVEISVSDFEDYIRADAKMQILTNIFEKQEIIPWETVCIILGVERRQTVRGFEADGCEG